MVTLASIPSVRLVSVMVEVVLLTLSRNTPPESTSMAAMHGFWSCAVLPSA